MLSLEEIIKLFNSRNLSAQHILKKRIESDVSKDYEIEKIINFFKEETTLNQFFIE